MPAPLGKLGVTGSSPVPPTTEAVSAPLEQRGFVLLLLSLPALLVERLGEYSRTKSR